MNKIKNYEFIHSAIQEAIEDFLRFRDKDSREELETILHIVDQIKTDTDVLGVKEQEIVNKIIDLSLKIDKYLNLKIYW